MEAIAVIGVDLAKSVFQVHGIDGQGAAVVRKRLSRTKLLPFFAKLPPCLVGMETCASANYWARELMGLGHEVRLMPPQYVKPYVKRSKNDASDAEAICEAVTRPSMRFVGVKSPEQQSVLMLHRTRSILTRQRAQIGNAIRAHLAEFGIVAPVGRQGLDRLIVVIGDEGNCRVPIPARRRTRRAARSGSAGPMIRENPLTTMRYPSASNWSGPAISEQGIMASGNWKRRINRSKTWPHPNNADASERTDLANGAPSRQGQKRSFDPV